MVKEGDVVATDQPICEIMTDKATVEISSPRSGRVVRVHGKPGDVMKVHSPLLELDLGAGARAAPAAVTPVAVAAVPSTPPPPVAAASAPAPEGAKPAPTVHPSVLARMPPPPRPAGEKALASPAVRHDARARGIDLDAVPGSGKSGRVTRSDLDAFGTEPKAPPALSAPAPTQGDERVKIIGLRRKIAEKMVQAWRTAPHFTYVDEVDASKLVEMRRALLSTAERQGVKISYLPFVMKALCLTFREFPTMNAVMDEEAFELVVRRDVNIGVATDTPAGLFVPVVKRVQEKSVLEIAAELADVTERTRQGKAKLDELSGGSFTVTSVGNIGGRFATPILNHPEVAILGVNQIHDRPVAVDGEVVVRPMMYLSPSFDHRVIDGAVAARFVAALKALLENPWQLVLELR